MPENLQNSKMSYEERAKIGFRTIKRIMQSGAFWPESFLTDSKIKFTFLQCFAILNALFYTLITVGQGVYMHVNRGHFVEVTEAASIFFAFITTLVKLIAMVIYRPQLQILIKDLMLTEFGKRMGVVRCAKENKGFEKLNENTSESLEESVKEHQFLLRTYGTCVCMSLISWTFLPAFVMIYRYFYQPELNEVKLFPYKVSVPWKANKSPNFELTYAAHAYTSVVTIPGYGGMDILMATLMIMVTRQYKVIKHVLNDIDHIAETIFENKLYSWLEGTRRVDDGEMELEDVYYDLVVQCVNQCARLIKINKLLNYVLGLILLAQILCSSIILCLVLFKISTEGRGPDEKIRFFFYMCANAYQLCVFCWYGQKLTTEAGDVARVANEMDWIKRPKRFCQGLMMVIRQSQKLQTINALGFADISLATFSAVSRMALSYFTLLSSFNRK